MQVLRTILMNYKNRFVFAALFFLAYFLTATLLLFLVFGVRESYTILLTPPSLQLSGISIISSALLATVIIIFCKYKSLELLPYPYFISGVHIGNLSLYIYFLCDACAQNLIHFKQIYFVLLGPLMELLMAYVFGFAFLALIPSIGSAFILYWFVQWKAKSIVLDSLQSAKSGK